MKTRLFIFGFALFIGGNVFAEETSLQDILKEQPWYDFDKRDYKKYTDKEIEEIIPDRRDKQSLPPLDPGMMTINTGLFTTLFYILLGLILVLILYALVRMRLKRKSSPAKKKKDSGIQISHHEFEKEYIGNYEKRIQKALMERDYEMAGELIYFYGLERIEDFHVVKLDDGVTPTEALRTLRYKDENIADLFKPAALLFDRIAYALRPVTQQEVEMALESVQTIGGKRK